MKENKENRALLLRLFGEEWLKKRDEYFQKIYDSRQPKKGQLKLEL